MEFKPVGVVFVQPFFWYDDSYFEKKKQIHEQDTWHVQNKRKTS
jgi:hypothetical protein